MEQKDLRQLLRAQQAVVRNSPRRSSSKPKALRPPSPADVLRVARSLHDAADRAEKSASSPTSKASQTDLHRTKQNLQELAESLMDALVLVDQGIASSSALLNLEQQHQQHQQQQQQYRVQQSPPYDSVLEEREED